MNDYEFEEALYIYNEHCAKDVQRIDISKYVSDHDLPITKFLPYAKLEDKKMIINLPFKLEHSFEKEFKFIVDKPDIAIGTPNLCYWYENYYYRFWSLNDDSATKKPTLISLINSSRIFFIALPFSSSSFMSLSLLSISRLSSSS